MEDELILNRFNLKENASQIQHNLVMVLHKNGAMTREDISKKIKKPRTTIFDNLLKLQKINIVTKFAVNNGERGRPVIFWKLNIE